MSEKPTTSSTFKFEEEFSIQEENFPKESVEEAIQDSNGITFGGENGTGATSGRPSCATSDGRYSTGPPSSRTTCATISYGSCYSSGGTCSFKPTCHPLPPGFGTPIIKIGHSPEFTFGGWDNPTENFDVQIGYDQQQPDDLDLEATYAAEEDERRQGEDAAASPAVTHSSFVSSMFLTINSAILGWIFMLLHAVIISFFFMQVCWPLRKLLDRGRNETSHSNSNDHETSIAGPPSEHVPNNVANSSNILSCTFFQLMYDPELILTCSL
ncbi:hypothetical protein ACLB2K_001686 [Fragaria x ananassa]